MVSLGDDGSTGAMSHNESGASCVYNHLVVDFLTRHVDSSKQYSWKRDRHYDGKWPGDAFCPCCHAHPKPHWPGYEPQYRQPANARACSLCLDAWTLTTLSKEMRDLMRANALGQPVYWIQWTPQERAEKLAKRRGAKGAKGTPKSWEDGEIPKNWKEVDEVIEGIKISI